MGFEKSITNRIISYLNSLEGCRAEKLKGSSSASGRADINACYNGRSIRIEVKTPDHKNRTSKKQDHNLEKWFNAGAAVMVAYSKESVETLVSYLSLGEVGCYEVKEKNGCISWISIPQMLHTS